MAWSVLPVAPPAHALRLAAGILGVTLGVAACDAPSLDWIDPAPVRTAMPSPLAHPPYAPLDSTLGDSTELAAFLLTQDRLREAGAGSLLESLVTALPEAADTASTTAPVAGAYASANASASASAGATAESTAAAPMAGMDHGTHRMDTAAAAGMAALGDGEAPVDASRCARTLRLADAPGVGTVAVWWTRRAGGRVHLVAAWRDGGVGAWRGPLPVDTLDQGPADAQAAEQGAHGCVRPAPSLAWDTRTRFLHVAYAVRGPEGPGVFYAHQMDPRAAFEVPVAVLYGERLGVVRVASQGDVVAVAYEDPNTRGRSRVGLAISRTAGHTFEEPRLIASADAGEARDPYVVVRGRAVVLGWSDVAAVADAEPVFVTRRVRVRR